MTIYAFRARPERVWLRRLEDWRQELATNQRGMAYLAPRCIQWLEVEIRRRFPGILS